MPKELSVDLLDGRYHSKVRTSMILMRFMAETDSEYDFIFFTVCAMGLSKKLWRPCEKISKTLRFSSAISGILEKRSKWAGNYDIFWLSDSGWSYAGGPMVSCSTI